MREPLWQLIDSWSPVDDFDDLCEQLERPSKWMDAHSPLLEDEATTVRLMIQGTTSGCQFAAATSNPTSQPTRIPATFSISARMKNHASGPARYEAGQAGFTEPV